MHDLLPFFESFFGAGGAPLSLQARWHRCRRRVPLLTRSNAETAMVITRAIKTAMMVRVRMGFNSFYILPSVSIS